MGREILQIKEFFFTFNLYVMQKNSWQNITDNQHLFYINGMETNKWQNFTDEGHLFYIKPP